MRRPVPLEGAAYAPYGDLIAPGDPAAARAANQGTARRWNDVAALASLRLAAAANLAFFRCAPRRDFPMELTLLERHAFSTQAFFPMRAARYLVVVALGVDAPDLETLRAFLAPGDTGITYRPGVWHHPLIALDSESDFACLVWEDGTPGDCDERALPPGVVIDL